MHACMHDPWSHLWSLQLDLQKKKYIYTYMYHNNEPQVSQYTLTPNHSRTYKDTYFIYGQPNTTIVYIKETCSIYGEFPKLGIPFGESPDKD